MTSSTTDANVINEENIVTIVQSTYGATLDLKSSETLEINNNIEDKPIQVEEKLDNSEINTETKILETNLNLNNVPETSTVINENKPHIESNTPLATEDSKPVNQQQSNPSETQQQTTEIKSPPKIDVGLNKNKDDMQSFEEWKEMKLKDKAKPKPDKPVVNGHNGDEKQRKNEDSSMRRLKNYASLDCGAKVVAYNQGSSNPSHILTESKDDYMLNSCSNRVWFVLELCEPIKIIRLELANFELFSNVPRQFRVFASERYLQSADGKDWPQKNLLGVFEASNSRSIQSFQISNLIESNLNSTSQKVIMFAKYLKFEMLSHYGTEHYCPLSLVRVYGNSMVDEEEEALQSGDAEDSLESSTLENVIISEPVMITTAASTTTTTTVTTTPPTVKENKEAKHNKETYASTQQANVESIDNKIVSGIKEMVKEAINHIVGGSSNAQVNIKRKF